MFGGAGPFSTMAETDCRRDAVMEVAWGTSMERLRLPITNKLITRPVALDLQTRGVEPTAAVAFPVNEILKCLLIHRTLLSDGLEPRACPYPGPPARGI